MQKNCPTCHGTGKVHSDCPYCRNSDDFYFTQLRPGSCTACGGDGYMEESCPVCNGTGQKEASTPTLAKVGNF